MKEGLEYRDIVGYEGVYKISEYGDVYSVKRIVNRQNNNKLTVGGKHLKHKINNNGYHYVALYLNGEGKNKYIHRLVAESFLINRCETVDHIDFDKSNNHFSNLEWVTQIENYNRFINTGRHLTSGKYVLNILNGVFHKSISEASRCYGIERRTLGKRLESNKSHRLILV